MKLTMTDEDVMRRVGALVNRAVVPAAPRKSWYRVPFAVTVRGLDAVRLMVRAKPQLSRARQHQIDAALRGWGSDRRQWSYVGLECAAEDCAAPASVRGLCRSHFNRWYKAARRGSATVFKPRPLTAADVVRAPEGHASTAACDVAWLSGLLEGEGSFSRTVADGHAYPVLDVKMSSKDVIERAASLLGASRIGTRAPIDPSWRITYVAKISGAAAAEWMQRLRPLMGERRRAAIDLALDSYYPIRLTEAPDHCVVPGCAEPHRGRGLCHKHYMSWSRDVARGRTPRVRPLRSN